MNTDDIELLARAAWRIHKEHGPSDAMTWERFGEHGKETWRDIVRSVLAAAQPPAPITAEDVRAAEDSWSALGAAGRVDSILSHHKDRYGHMADYLNRRTQPKENNV